MKTFNLEIITPEKIAFNDEVNIITVPGADGQIGILPGHIALFCKLSEGEIKIVTNKGEIFLAIGSGFLEIAKNKAVVLVTSAYHSDELNESEILEAKKRAEKALAEKPLGEALKLAEAQFRRSEIALKVLYKRRRPFKSVS